MSSQAPSYRGYRFPPEIISHAVWLYHRFSLSFRDAEDLLAQRGVTVTYETIRQWCLTFGPAYARTLRRRRGRLTRESGNDSGEPANHHRDRRRRSGDAPARPARAEGARPAPWSSRPEVHGRTQGAEPMKLTRLF